MLSNKPRFVAIGTWVVDTSDREDLNWTTYQADTRLGAALVAELFNTANEEDSTFTPAA